MPYLGLPAAQHRALFIMATCFLFVIERETPGGVVVWCMRMTVAFRRSSATNPGKCVAARVASDRHKMNDRSFFSLVLCVAVVFPVRTLPLFCSVYSLKRSPNELCTYYVYVNDFSFSFIVFVRCIYFPYALVFA